MEELLKQLIELQQRQTIALEKIANYLEPIDKPAPNYQEILENFSTFDWESINAKVEIVDSYGVAVVTWNNKQYKRRSPSNVYGTSIFFSRYVSKSEDGTNQYERLITFKPMTSVKIQPISRNAETILKGA